MKRYTRFSDFPKNFQYTDAFVNRSMLTVVGYDLDKNEKCYLLTNKIMDHPIEMFVPNPNGDKLSFPSGQKLKPIRFNTIKESVDFKKENFSVPLYGDFDLAKQWVNDFYAKYNAPLVAENVNFGIIDIEVEMGDRFPRPTQAPNAITCITLYCSKSDKYYLFSRKEIQDIDKFEAWIKEDNEYAEKEIQELKKPKLKTLKNWVFKFCGTEEDLLIELLRTMNLKEEIDIISGWNSDRFDLPYLYYRLEKLFGPDSGKSLSPFKIAWAKELDIKLKGISHIDYMKLYKNFTKKEKLESYRLQFVSEYETKRGKIQYDGTLKTLWERDSDLYMFYNLMDVHRVAQIDAKRKFIKLCIQTIYGVRGVFTNIFSTVRQLEAEMFRHLTSRNLAWDPKASTKFSQFDIHEQGEFEEEKYPGGYVYQPDAGFYRWIVSFDLNSLYPHLQMKFNVSPETHVEDAELFAMLCSDYDAMVIAKEMIAYRNTLPSTGDSDTIQLEWNKLLVMFYNRKWDLSWLSKYNLTMSPAIEFYRKSEDALLPNILEGWYKERKVTKKKEMTLRAELEKLKKGKDKDRVQALRLEAENCHIQQIALKYLLNGSYGALAFRGFRNYDIRLARSVTMGGRMAIYGLGEHIDSELSKLYDSMSKS